MPINTGREEERLFKLPSRCTRDLSVGAASVKLGGEERQPYALSLIVSGITHTIQEQAQSW